VSRFAVRQPRHAQGHPKGWEPGIVWDPSKGGTLTTGPIDGDLDPALWDQLIVDFGLDPNVTEVLPGSVQVRAWDAAIGNNETKRMLYYRATIKPRENRDHFADVEALCAAAAKKRPAKPKTVAADLERALVVLASDWQLGKAREEGGGSAETAERILVELDMLREKLKNQERIKRPISTVYLVGLGDLIEQCSGYYAMQSFAVDLDRRAQMRLGRQLLLAYVDAIVDLGYPLVMASVAGNHGENRNSSGKAYTTWTDNDDLAIFEQVGEILAANHERYGNVSIVGSAVIAQDDLTLTLDVAGIPIAFAHGHQVPSGGAEKWWQGQALGRRPVSDAEILVTAHKHNFQISESTGRTWMQTPANDGGSFWFTAQTGQASPAGMLTFCVSTLGYGKRGWGDLEILDPAC
jgi:hypothetical protein